jgi:hypothetical protein
MAIKKAKLGMTIQKQVDPFRNREQLRRTDAIAKAQAKLERPGTPEQRRTERRIPKVAAPKYVNPKNRRSRA